MIRPAKAFQRRTLGDKLHHLAFVAPKEILTIEVIVDELLQRHREEQAMEVRAMIRAITRSRPQE